MSELRKRLLADIDGSNELNNWQKEELRICVIALDEMIEEAKRDDYKTICKDRIDQMP